MISLGFPSYEQAALRKVTPDTPTVSLPSSDVEKSQFNLYSFGNLSPLILSGFKLLHRLLTSYALLPLTVRFLRNSDCERSACEIILLLVAFREYFFKPKSPISGEAGRNYYGAQAKPGVYCSPLSTFLLKVLDKCPNICSAECAAGGLPGLASTPWVVTGDLRTLLPFLIFHPSHVRYTRRWVRVPLSAGPLSAQATTATATATATASATTTTATATAPEATKLTAATSEEQYEAVAVDYSPGTCRESSESEEYCRGSKTVFLILAGLTGGSSEGYVVDLVRTANEAGHDCFVMVGRGLGGAPCASDALFHGARTSDLTAVAEQVRSCLPTDAKLFAVGISMGGIIILNAVSRGVLRGVDGVVSVGGCFDTAENASFQYSKSYWQPLLAFALKENFAAPPKSMALLQQKLGEEAHKKIENLSSVFDFDCVAVTAIHDFYDVQHYYGDMCHGSRVNTEATLQQQETIELSVPTLAIQAMDDPIIHIDTMFMTLPAADPSTDSHSTAAGGLVKSTGAIANIVNLVCLVTETGGHIGWPVGFMPWRHKWKFQNNLVLEFCNGIALSK